MLLFMLFNIYIVAKKTNFLRNRTLTDTISLGQGGAGSDGNEGHSTHLRSPELESLYQFSLISFLRVFTSLQGI